jgi:predicted RNA-binding protein with PUA-like domain
MNRYLLKTEPSDYSFDDLVRDKSTVWDGVTNALALIHIRAMLEGDECIIYHTGDERQAVGLAHVVRKPYPDPKAADPKQVVVDVLCGPRLPKPVSLEQLKDDSEFVGSPLLKNSRLSVVPLTPAQYLRIVHLSGLPTRRR